jgi:polyphosphate kinase
VAEHAAIFATLRQELADDGVASVDYAALPDHHERLRERFIDEIFPVLTPLAVDPGHPFPYISTLSLSIAVGMRDPETGERRFARVKVPQILPRLVEVEPHTFVLLDQVIEANLDLLFSGMEILETHLFRVTRNADLAIEEDEADDLVMAIEEELRRRRFGEAVRLEVERSMPAATRLILLRGIGLTEDDCYDRSGMLTCPACGRSSTSPARLLVPPDARGPDPASVRRRGPGLTCSVRSGPANPRPLLVRGFAVSVSDHRPGGR